MEAVAHAEEQAARAFDRGIMQAIVGVRWLTLLWATVGLVIEWEHLTRQVWAVGLMVVALCFTAWATVQVRLDAVVLLHPAVIALELGIGTALLIGDGLVYEAARGQSLPWAWPAIGLVVAGVAFGPQWALLAAGGLGVASFIGEGLNSERGGWGIAASSKLALYALAALGAGYVAQRLRRAEREISISRAREEMARELHDGVLQTLAVVQRRSNDPELSALAQHQDQELRDFLFGHAQPERTLPVALREVAAQFKARHGVTASVVAADDLPLLGATVVEAVAGAVGEALTNAAKHGGASRVTVFAEPEDDLVFCSVKDDGSGFDPDVAGQSPHNGQGINRSIQGRIAEVGGRVDIRSKPGRGTEVCLWVPNS